MHTQNGYVHSIETMGMVDGPGIRTVFFLQGCPLRCAYCHNPDTQAILGGKAMTVAHILEMASKYRSYYNATGGGITFSGGEPLIQGAFLAEAVKALHTNGYHVCIDTSGIGDHQYYDDVLPYVDLVLLDLKAFEEKAHLEMTEIPLNAQTPFIKALIRHQTKIIIRHVMVPGFTDHESDIQKMLTILKPLAKNIEKIEILPYHKSGIEKYSQLNMPYRLDGVPEMSKTVAESLEKYANELLLVSQTLSPV